MSSMKPGCTLTSLTRDDGKRHHKVTMVEGDGPEKKSPVTAVLISYDLIPYFFALEMMQTVLTSPSGTSKASQRLMLDKIHQVL